MKNWRGNLLIVLIVLGIFFLSPSNVCAEEVIGVWKGKLINMWQTITITQSNSSYYANIIYTDGKSESTRRLDLIPIKYLGKFRYIHKGHEDVGDYYQIDQFGNLLIGDNFGVIDTYFPKK